MWKVSAFCYARRHLKIWFFKLNFPLRIQLNRYKETKKSFISFLYNSFFYAFIYFILFTSFIFIQEMFPQFLKFELKNINKYIWADDSCNLDFLVKFILSAIIIYTNNHDMTSIFGWRISSIVTFKNMNGIKHYKMKNWS